ncbi:MAG: permease, partial [Chloroflexota bacterium]
MTTTSMTLNHSPAPSRYKLTIAGFISSLALTLFALVDIRRGFLFASAEGFWGYFSSSPYHVLGVFHIILLAIAIPGMVAFYKLLQAQEKELKDLDMEKYVKIAAFIIFGMLVVDIFTYRGVPAFQIANSGKIGAGWLEAWGVEGWLQPFALAASYIITVWHATFLGILFAALSLTILPRYLASFYTKTGFGGSLFGATYALPQPFCSCCASVVTPTLQKNGASRNFMLAFVVGSPMLNITGLVLAAVLLPTPYAITRILGGIVLTIPVTYYVSRLAEKWDLVDGPHTDNWFTRFTNKLAGKYCELFHLDEIIEGRKVDTPSQFIATYAEAVLQLAKLLIPTLFIWSVLSAAFFMILPAGYSNNIFSVIVTAIAGTFFMISTWTEIPVAMQMINAGYFAPAATLLLVLPPVSLPCLMILGGAIGKFRIVGILSVAVIFIGTI